MNLDGTTTSNEATATPVAGVPAKPTGLTTRLRTGRIRQLDWDPVADPSILRYEFTTDDGRTWSWTWSPLPSFTESITGSSRSVGVLPEGQFLSGYTFRIRAVNTAGPGPASDPAEEETIQARVLSASLEWDATTKKATLVWDQTEHANLRWWSLYFSRSVHGSTASSWDAILPIGTTRYEIPATFNAGATIAVWIVGCVNPECRALGVTANRLSFQAGVPNTVVTGFSATPGDASITLAWNAPTDSGITHFEYEVALSASTARDHNDIPDGDDADTNPGNETSHTVTAINNARGVTDGTAPVNGESYRFRLRAVNANRDGPWTAWTPVMPLAAGVPAAPSGVVQLFSGDPSAGGHGHGHGATPGLTYWDEPHDPSITVYQRISDDGWVDLPGTDATTTGVNFRVSRLRAVNANGVGPSVGATDVYSPAPARPTGLQAAPGNGRVTLTWDDPGKGVYIEFYRYTADGGETWTEIPDSRSTVQGQFTRYTVPGLTNGQAYTFAIQTENDTGTSPVSESVIATPRGGAP